MGKSKWESLVEIDRRFGRRSAELRAARTAQEAAVDVDMVAPPIAPIPAPPSAWWGVALVALAILCAVAFSLCGQ